MHEGVFICLPTNNKVLAQQVLSSRARMQERWVRETRKYQTGTACLENKSRLFLFFFSWFLMRMM
jgi:hypothetical protein